MANNTYYKFLLINLITIFSVFSHIHAQGLQFYGNQNSIEQRTTYIPFNDKEQLPVFYDCIDIEFDLRISQENTFGYLLHMSNSEDPSTTYILTYSYAKDNESVFRFNTEGQINHTSISLSNDSILSHWLPVKLHIDFSLGESIMSIGNHTVKGNIKTIKQSHKFHPFLVFGRREHLVDVPEFAIRELKISDKKQNYTFLLNESNGNDVHDTKEKIQGKVINPYWLINDSYHWQKVATFSSQGCMGTNFNEQQQKIQFITAVIHNPELLVIDEPFSGLDPINTELLKSAILELVEKGTYIIMSSHQMASIEEFCTDILILKRGNIFSM